MNKWLLRLLPVLAIAAALALVLAAYSISRSNDRLADLIAKNHRSLLVDCAKQRDLTHKIIRTEKALKENPGPLVFGIPRVLIVQGLLEDIDTHSTVAKILGNACLKENA